MKSLVTVALLTGTAHAGGMVLPVHGVRGIERAGAIVAGADDAGALFDNPAGLAHLTGGSAMLVDAAFVAQSVDYARIDSGGNQLGAIDNSYPGITVPTIAIAAPINDKLVLAGGVTAPYAGIQRYAPDGAARYTSASLAESLFVTLAVGAAYAITPHLRVGVTVQDQISKLDSRVSLSGCPGQTVCAPEDPEFDADTRITQTDLWSPSASAGVQWDPIPEVTLGLVGQLGAKVDGTGKLQTRLPSSSFFDGATVRGDSVSLAMTLPPSIRTGIEVRPTDQLRIEAALDVEFWGAHKDIAITPHGVVIDNQAGVGMYTIAPTVIPRNYKTSYAPSLGLEYHFANPFGAGAWQVGAGYAYETAAAPAAYVSTLTVDAAKHIVGLGGSFDLGTWQIGAAIGFVKLKNVDVSLDDAKVMQLSPIRDQPAAVPVNAGAYQSHYLLAGMRFARTF